ncbi:organic cation/carnitine transporter 4-like isoform X1 [Camellia sinensis]|uniref:organic cation/carnitine transporter 4-like isoform X1 n=1 Tax=Camellia sinensis TaxID=4442 RepID=UPI001036A171|nr:organic cation/carnitine transporter 4-like isoform X1 [Camellia sinensis]
MLTTSSSSPADLSVPLIPPSKKADEPVAGKQKLCIDDMLNRFCGEFGVWQLRHFVLTSLAWALEAFHTMVMIFADREPEWRCLIPGSCSTGSGTVCGLEPGSWEWIGGSASSTVAEWGLICGQKYKVGLVQSLFFGGCMIDSIFFVDSRVHFVY